MDKSKRMFKTETEMIEKKEQASVAKERCAAVAAFTPSRPESKCRQEQEVKRLQEEFAKLQLEIVGLQSRLEVETIEFLAGLDTDIHVPGPNNILRAAS